MSEKPDPFYTLIPDDGRGARYDLKIDSVNVGTCIILEYPSKDAIAVWSLEIYPSFRGLGHGKAMIDAICGIARGKSLKRVWLRVDKDNDVAISMYTKQGFKVVAEYPEDLAMERQA